MMMKLINDFFVRYQNVAYASLFVNVFLINLETQEAQLAILCFEVFLFFVSIWMEYCTVDQDNRSFQF